jgi:hypothetical protein
MWIYYGLLSQLECAQQLSSSEGLRTNGRQKEGKYKGEGGKERIRSVLRIVLREMWTIDDLEDRGMIHAQGAEIYVPGGLRYTHKDAGM